MLLLGAHLFDVTHIMAQIPKKMPLFRITYIITATLEHILGSFNSFHMVPSYSVGAHSDECWNFREIDNTKIPVFEGFSG